MMRSWMLMTADYQMIIVYKIKAIKAIKDDKQ